MLVSAIALSGLTYTLWMFSKDIVRGQLALAVDHTLFLAVAMLLSYGVCTYLCARRGYLSRVLTFNAVSNSDLGSIRTKQEMPTVTVLIPSYQEDVHVMRKTLISAALQAYPRRRVVLLIDNPPSPLASERRKLDAARQLPTEVAQLFARPQRDCFGAMERFLQRTTQAPLNGMDESQNLAHLYRVIASWYEEQAHAHPQLEYSDSFFADMTFKQPAARLRDDAAHWKRRAHTAATHQDHELFAREYRRLLNLFSVEITSFERKRYLNLSHYPNKASNLNSYIALLGGSYRETPTPTGVLLTPTSPDHADFTVPAAEFILMLDADTLIASEYTMRLVDFLCQPGHEAIAVVQSPYSTFPRPPHTLQRIAGAQTDIQYLLHQGLTYYDATYWVGANAVVRTAALSTIMTLAEERGFKVKKFIQDHTLIEDTESSIDLICRGWKLFNYPQRLAFSATTPDFGSLLIQRRRWANGGLLVLPKLWRYVRSTAVTPGVIAEFFIRAQYLLSLGPVSLAFLVVVVFAVGQALWINWMVVTALVYYAFYLRDLRLNGYG